MRLRPLPRQRARAKDRSLDRKLLSLRRDSEQYSTLLWPLVTCNHSCIRQELACYNGGAKESQRASARRHSVERDSRSHHNHRNPTPPAVQDENILAPLRDDPTDELILQMVRELQLLKGTVEQLTGLKDMVDQLTRLSQPQLHSYAPQQTRRHEDGKPMLSFLANYEIGCLEGQVPPDMWATRMRRYLTGVALDFYLHMRRVGIDLQQ